MDYIKEIEDNLKMKVDELGAMFLKREGTENDALPVVIGSHLDTQPTGGKYDGVRSMPSYSYQISENDRWAIVAYVRTLQLSQNSNL